MSDSQQNPDVRYEATDVDSRAVLRFGIILAVSLAALMGVLWGMFRLFSDQETARTKSAYPLATAERQRLTTEDSRLPPKGPLIEGFPGANPQHTLGRSSAPSGEQKNATDDAFLNEFGWLDKDHAVARIPITEAMKRILAKLPIAKDAAPPRSEASQMPSVSSSGRMPIGGSP